MTRIRKKTTPAGPNPPKPLANTHAAAGRPAILVVLLMLGVGGVVAVVQGPALSAQALAFDDDQYLTGNVLVRNPSWSAAGRFVAEVRNPSTVRGYYQPLTMISLMFDTALGGRPDNLRAYHRTNLLLHALNAALVMLFLYGLFKRPWIAAGLALLYGVHPLTVESVAWVAERKTLLATFFALGAMVCYVRFARHTRWPWYVATLGLYVLALLSKPTTTPVPLLLLLLDYWPLRRFSGRAVLEKLPLLALAAMSAVITVVSQSQTAITVGPTASSLLRPILIVGHDVVFYVGKLVWPASLTPHVPFPDPLTLGQPAVLVGVLGTMLLVAAVAISGRWTRAVVVGSLFWFLALAPTLGIIGFTIVIAADKYMYLPMIGLLLPLAALAGWLFDRRPAAPARLLVVGVAGLAILVALTALTRRQLGYWQTSETLGARMVAVAPAAGPPRIHYGVALARAGKLDAARVQFEEAVRRTPEDPKAHSNLGDLMGRLGRPEEALPYYRAALAAGSKQAAYGDRHVVLNSLGGALSQLGRLDEAAAVLNEALAAKPEFAPALNNLGAVYMQQGQLEPAAALYERALQTDPANARAHGNLGFLLLQLGRPAEALPQFEAAERVQPDYVRARFGRAAALENLGRTSEAIAVYQELLQANPGDTAARERLAALRAQNP